MEYFVLVLIDVAFVARIIKMMKTNKMRCHRNPNRCLKIMRDQNWRICTRCLFMNIGILLFPLLFYVTKEYELNLWLTGLFCMLFQVPMLIDGFTQNAKKRTSNNFLRAATGLVSGIGLSLGISFILIIGGY